MSINLNPTQNTRMRLIKLGSMISLIFFVVLLGWQLLVLATGNYPEHILPAVKFLGGTEESVPVAYVWTIRLAVITMVGMVVSLVGWIAVNRCLGKNKVRSLILQTQAGNKLSAER